MLFISALALSCREEQTTEVAKAESPYRISIEHYLDQLTPETGSDPGKLSVLRNAIDFSNVSLHVLTNNENVLIADVGKIDLDDGPVVKALFFIQQGSIVRSNLVAFSNTQADHNSIILSTFARRFDPQTYNGRIAYYSVYQDILFFNEIENGRLTSNGITQAKSGSKINQSGRTEGCIDWYLITTYHYTSGGTSTTEAYMFTTCDACQANRLHARINCGSNGAGVGAGTAGAAFPGYALNGDRYIFTDPYGKTTTYIYNQASAAWTIYLVVLPEAVVQSQRSNYSYLSNDGPPADNTAVAGPDGLLYIYDAYSAAWEAGLNFNYGGDSPSLIISNRNNYFQCLKNNRAAILTIYADQPIPGSTAPVSGSDVGHSWIGISQNINGRTINRVFGYYPANGASPLSPRDAGVLVNDAGHPYDVSVSIPISAMDVLQIINYASTRLPANYDLNTFNCTDFVVDACRAAGFILPENLNSWLGGGGLCPGQLGEDLRTLDIPGKTETRDTDGGNAPADSGC
jgi:hypothetical protein